MIRALRNLIFLMMAVGTWPALAEEAAKDVMLVFDNSGSMRKVDPNFLATQAVTGFIGTLDGDARAGVIIFDHKVNLAVPLTPLADSGKTAVIESLRQINYRGKWTNSPKAVEQAIYELKVNGREGVEKLIVFMTDGIVETGDPSVDKDQARWLREELAQDAARNGIRIFAIAFTENADYQLIQSLATKTNGEYYRALKAEDLQGAFERVNAAIARLTALKPAEPEVPAPQAPAAEAPAVPATQAAAPAATPAGPTAPPPMTAEQQAAEEFAKAAGVPKEELEKLPEGQAIVVPPPPPEEGRPAGTVVIAVAVVGVAIVAAVVVLLLRKRGGARPAAKEEAEYVPQAFLNDLQGNTSDTRHELGAKPAMLGRVGGADEHLHYIVVNQATIGRRHALIEYKDFSYWIIDQGSINGTFVNGERVTTERRLKHGDRIRLHKYDFEFVMPEVADASKTVFSAASDKTVMAEATLVSRAAAMAPAAAVVAAPPPAPEEEAEEEEEAFDVTGGAFAESPAVPAREEEEEEAAAFDVTGGAFTAEPAVQPAQAEAFDLADFGTEMPAAAEPEAAPPAAEPPVESLATVMLEPEPPAAPPAEPIGTMVLEPEPEAHTDFHDRDTIMRGPPPAAEAPRPLAAAAPPAESEEGVEDLSLDAFISTTVLEATQKAAPPPSEDVTVQSTKVHETAPAAPAPSAPAAPQAPVRVEEELSLDDFIEETALGSGGAETPEPSDRTEFLSEEESDRTILPSEVPKPKKRAEQTHLGDTTVFNAEEPTLPPKR